MLTHPTPAQDDNRDVAAETEVDDSVAEATGDDSTDGAVESPTRSAVEEDKVTWPMITLAVGIAIVLSLIVAFKVNAFIALISAAIVVSLMSPGDVAIKIDRVAKAFGATAGGIGIVIAMAAVIGKCMLDSGAADRIVRFFIKLLGEKRAPLALMGSGYLLAIPVFFDTVFYLLVPLARSLHRQTQKNYLKYILAIAAGGAITHSLVPPTPGPLLMASTLGVDLGLMIVVGAIVALPAAFAGIVFATIADAIMKTPMRPLPGDEEEVVLTEDELPGLGISLLPVLLPVFLISINTILTTIADQDPVAKFSQESFEDLPLLAARLQVASESEELTVERHIYDRLPDGTRLVLGGGSLDDDAKAEIESGFNALLGDKSLYDEDGFLGVKLSAETTDLLRSDRLRMSTANLHHMNRLLLEQALNRTDDGSIAIVPHQWLTTKRKAAKYGSLIGNANLALLLSTIIAIWMLAKQRSMGRNEIAAVVETALMSGGVIILITAGGGAFGAMLKAAEIGEAVETIFGTLIQAGEGSLVYLFMGFLIAMVLKIAQGSGTVAMIVGSSMMAAIVNPDDLSYNIVYLATSVGAGSLVGSWMNDSGFWIFAKMGRLTEIETLKSWTLMLIVLGLVSLGMSVLLATVLPLI
jgi:H+/gluconate symporter-like permease